MFPKEFRFKFRCKFKPPSVFVSRWNLESSVMEGLTDSMPVSILFSLLLTYKLYTLLWQHNCGEICVFVFISENTCMPIVQLRVVT
jgi:hypothetical protein